jgi:Uma2 family endonuclease
MVVRTGERLTLEEFLALPESRHRVEYIGGEVVAEVTEPALRHLLVHNVLQRAFTLWAVANGGMAFSGPFDLLIPGGHVFQADVLLLRAEHLARMLPRPQRWPPDLVAEITSPSTRDRDLGIKRDGYQAMGVPEYWVVDLRDDVVWVHRLDDGRYGQPVARGRGDVLTTAVAPGLAVDVTGLLDVALPV